MYAENKKEKESRSPSCIIFFFFFFSTRAVSLPKAASSKVFNKEQEPRQEQRAENESLYMLRTLGSYSHFFLSLRCWGVCPRFGRATCLTVEKVEAIDTLSSSLFSLFLV